jgi:hypothetical protein
MTCLHTLHVTHLCLILWQLESWPRGYRGHSVTLFRGRIYDAAETRSMPFEVDYLNRCVRENSKDNDTFHRFVKVVVFRPTDKLREALDKKRKRLATEKAGQATKRATQ